MPFQTYKKQQGMWVRWGTFLCLATLFVFGTYRLYTTCFPDKIENKSEDLLTSQERFTNWLYDQYSESVNIPFVDVDVPAVTPRLLISLAFGFSLLMISWGFCFRRERSSEFLIDTESEMRKVSWPTTKEVINSSTVVIITMVILGAYLYAADGFLAWVCQKLFTGK